MCREITEVQQADLTRLMYQAEGLAQDIRNVQEHSGTLTRTNVAALIAAFSSEMFAFSERLKYAVMAVNGAYE